MIDPARVVKRFQKQLKKDLPEIYSALPPESRKVTGRSRMYGTLKGWEEIERIETRKGEMLAPICVYYRNHLSDTLLPNMFPHCWYRKNFTDRWRCVYFLLYGEELTRKQRHGVNSSFAEYFGVQGEQFIAWLEQNRSRVIARGPSLRANTLLSAQNR